MRARASALLLALVVVGLLSGLADAAIVHLIGREAPEVSGGKWLNSPAIKLEKLRPNVVVLHLSDPTRIVSKGALPKLKSIWDEHGSGDLRVVEVIVEESSMSPEVYVEDQKVGWPVTVDYQGKTALAYPGTSLPRTYLIGPDGIVHWHGHVGALSDALLEGQLRRVDFFVKDRVPRKAKALAKAMVALDYEKALGLADKLLADEYADDAEKDLAQRAREDAGRHAEARRRMVDQWIKKGDRARAWLELQSLLEVFDGTEWEAGFREEFERQDELERTHYVLALRKELDGILEDAGSRRRKDVESCIRRLEGFAERTTGTIEQEEAREWVRALRERLESGSLK